MGKTADLTDVQKTVTDTLYMEDKPQNIIAKEAGCSECCVQADLWKAVKFQQSLMMCGCISVKGEGQMVPCRNAQGGTFSYHQSKAGLVIMKLFFWVIMHQSYA
ncbi:hypothetical protein XENORESO_020697 [Xenotaenia resolanae]|uniref:Uncharacterized protein n=1 Tax=Xenotaenia resolanae TaxID=208358 RepID=A0ABV0WBN7_9TELE